MKANDILTTENFYVALQNFNSYKKHKKLKEKVFYVYYKPNGSIACLSPLKAQDINLPYVQFSESQVSDFLNDKLKLRDYRLVPKAENELEYTFEKIKHEIEYQHFSDEFISEILPVYIPSAPIQIITDTNEKLLKISFHANIKQDLYNRLVALSPSNVLIKEEYKDTFDIRGESKIILYFTVHKTPLFLIKEVTVDIFDLIISDYVTIPYFNSRLDNCSLYSKKIFNNYSYRII